MGHDFDDIEIKANAPALLEHTLKYARTKRMVHTGSMSDPYQPVEMETGLMRKALSIIHAYGFGVTILTKSNCILRDIDLLRQINERTKCVVQMTLTTFDENLCRKIEPNVCTTKERFETLLRMREAGIPTVVWLCPILPFINDTSDNLSGILEYCVRAGVYGIVCPDIGMTLREGSRDYFYQQLDGSFPGLKAKYMQIYGDKYMLESLDASNLMSLFRQRCARNGIAHDHRQIFTYLRTFEEKPQDRQLELF
jgi:DNA repair photolyase